MSSAAVVTGASRVNIVSIQTALYDLQHHHTALVKAHENNSMFFITFTKGNNFCDSWMTKSSLKKEESAPHLLVTDTASGVINSFL